VFTFGHRSLFNAGENAAHGPAPISSRGLGSFPIGRPGTARRPQSEISDTTDFQMRHGPTGVDVADNESQPRCGFESPPPRKQRVAGIRGFAENIREQNRRGISGGWRWCMTAITNFCGWFVRPRFANSCASPARGQTATLGAAWWSARLMRRCGGAMDCLTRERGLPFDQWRAMAGRSGVGSL
jgi:hypothetical protein